MTVTGEAIRQTMLDERPALGWRGQTSAGGGNGPPSFLTDAVKLQMSTRDVSEFGAAFLRIGTGDANNNGRLAKVDRIDPATGNLYFTPATVANAVAAATNYEIWKHNIDPDLVDKAIGRALKLKNRHWRLKALSVLPDVWAWATAGWGDPAGGLQNATAQPQTLDFPFEYDQQAMQVTCTNAGFIGSPTYKVQPGEQLRIFGWVSVDALNASILLRDLSNLVYIPIVAVSTFTLPGWQYFNCLATVPAGCGKVQLWLGGPENGDITNWAGVGMLPARAKRFTLPARVFQESDVGRVFAHTGAAAPNIQSADMPDLVEIPRDTEARVGARVRVTFARPPASSYGVYYEEGHHFADLWTAHITNADRNVGDIATTDCELPYVAAAAVVELLHGMKKTPELEDVYADALGDLTAWEHTLGPHPKVLTEPSRSAPPRMVRL